MSDNETIDIQNVRRLLYTSDEWKPDEDDDEELWDTKYKKNALWKYKKIPKIEYVIDDKMEKDIRKCQKIYKDTVKYTDKKTSNIIKVYRLFDGKHSLISTTTSSLLCALKFQLLSFYKNDKLKSQLLEFVDYTKVKAELLMCLKNVKGSKPSSELNEIREMLNKKYDMKDEESICNFYKATIKSIMNYSMKEEWLDDDNYEMYYIYECINMKNKKSFIFYDTKKLKLKTSDDVIEYIYEKYCISLNDEYEYEIKILEEREELFSIDVERKCDSYMCDADFESIVKPINYYIIKDNISNLDKTQLKKELHCKIQYLIAKKFNDVEEMKPNVKSFVYLIKIGDMKYVGLSTTGKVNDLFRKLYVDANENDKSMKRVITAIRNANFRDISIKILFKKTEKTRNDTHKMLENKILYYNARDKTNGLNYIDEEKKKFFKNTHQNKTYAKKDTRQEY